MATEVHPTAHAPQASSTTLGETTAVVTSGAWFSAVTSAAFADTAAEAHDAGARELVLDLTGVRAVDAAGTATLAALVEQLEGCEIAVAAIHPGLVDWLGSAPLDVELALFASLEDALADVLRRPV